MIAVLDASALIYLIEGKAPFLGKLQQELATLARRHRNVGVAISRLSWLECRVGPMKSGDAPLLAQFDAFFSRPDISWIELSRDVVELATAIRGRHGLRTPDALQAACCLQLGNYHLFLTGDKGFRRVAGLHVHLLAAK